MVKEKENTMVTDWLEKYGDPSIEKQVESELSGTQFIVYKPVHMDGCYRFGKETINCTKFSIVHKPKRIHRFFMRVIFGLYWEDNK